MGTHIFLGNPPADIKQWIIEHSKPQLTELCFTAEASNSSVKLQKKGSAYIAGFNGLEYKINNNGWTSYAIGSTITLANIGDKVYMRAVAAGNPRMGASYGGYHKFIITGKIAASGNINTLLNPDPNAEVSLAGKYFCYCNMFNGCTSLTQAPELPATTLADNCYSNMFQNCTSLTQAPELPAMTLADFCYRYMFYGCTSLTQAPALPATTLADFCYMNMFSECSKFSKVHMKQEMKGVYNASKHGDTTKTVVYDLI